MPGRTRSRGKCWAAIRLSHRPEPSGRAVHGRSMDWTLEDNMFVLLRHTHKPQRRPYPSVQAGAETPDTSAEAVKLDPGSSWEVHSGWVGAGVGDKNAESCGVVQTLRISSVIRQERRTYVIVVSWTEELLCCGYKWVSRFETAWIPTRWTGDYWVEQVSRRHGTVCQPEPASRLKSATCDQARSHGGIWGQCPPNFFCDLNFFVPGKICFKNMIKTKIVPP